MRAEGLGAGGSTTVSDSGPNEKGPSGVSSVRVTTVDACPYAPGREYDGPVSVAPVRDGISGGGTASDGMGIAVVRVIVVSGIPSSLTVYVSVISVMEGGAPKIEKGADWPHGSPVSVSEAVGRGVCSVRVAWEASAVEPSGNRVRVSMEAVRSP